MADPTGTPTYYCPRCSSTVTSGGRFCATCGLDFSTYPPSTSPSAPAAPEAPAAPPPPPPAPAPTAPDWSQPAAPVAAPAWAQPAQAAPPVQPGWPQAPQAPYGAPQYGAQQPGQYPGQFPAQYGAPQGGMPGSPYGGYGATAAPAPGPTPATIGMLAGAAAILIGSFLPWATLNLYGYSTSISGIEGGRDGTFTLILAAIVGVFAVVGIVRANSLKMACIGGLICALIAGAIGLYDAADIGKLGYGVAIGIGIWIVIGGAAIAALSAVVGLARGR